MKIWIYLNGVQQGPYTFDELRRLPIDANTPVWYDGLPQWSPAGQAPATAPLFAAPQQPQPGPGQWQQPGQPQWQQPGAQQWQQTQWQQPQAQQWQQPQYVQAPPRPATYLVWAILLTVLCCSPLAIAAIVTGAITNSRYNSGDYAGARSMSNVTEWLIILAILFGVLALPLGLLSLLA